MNLSFLKIFRGRLLPRANDVSIAGVQPGLWSAAANEAGPTNLASTADGGESDAVGAHRSHNPFASAASPPLDGRPASGIWERLLIRVGWRPRSGACRRVFTNLEQLELVLGRPRGPVRNQNLKEGPPVQARRSGPGAGRSKVIYESPPVIAADAARMMEESDRAYERLRGRRLEKMRVTAD